MSITNTIILLLPISSRAFRDLVLLTLGLHYNYTRIYRRASSNNLILIACDVIKIIHNDFRYQKLTSSLVYTIEPVVTRSNVISQGSNNFQFYTVHNDSSSLQLYTISRLYQYKAYLTVYFSISNAIRSARSGIRAKQ